MLSMCSHLPCRFMHKCAICSGAHTSTFCPKHGQKNMAHIGSRCWEVGVMDLPPLVEEVPQLECLGPLCECGLIQASGQGQDAVALKGSGNME